MKTGRQWTWDRIPALYATSKLQILGGEGDINAREGIEVNSMNNICPH